MFSSSTRSAIAVIVLVAALAPSLALGGPPSALHQAGRWLVDEEGRAVILHGVNQVSKLPPYLPSALGFGADDVAAIAAEGFNTVRTGLAHKGLVPAPGVYDGPHLDDFEATVDLLTAQGIYVMIDFHQDLYNERYQGNGMADWMTVDSSPIDPTLLPTCDNGFPGNIFACGFLWEAFDRFLGINGKVPEIGPRAMTFQEEFADAWRQVATRFAGDPLVFGYDLLNEPYPGTATLSCMTPAGCPAPVDAQLTVFSNLVADAVREVDPDTIVFYEPYATNFNAGFATNHGDVDAGQVGFSFHLYACLTTPGPAIAPASLSEACRPAEQKVFNNAEAQAAEFADVPLLTEFGATDDLPSLHRLADLADASMMGWQYWAWWNRDPCCARDYENIIDDPANPATPAHLDQPKLDALARPYPRAVAGTPLGWAWDRTARRFTFSYATAPVDGPLAPGTVTEVWIPQRHFPGGYDIVGLAGATVTSAPNAERLELVASPGATTVSLAVVPAGCGAVPAVGCRRPVVANTGSFALTDSATNAKDRLQWSWTRGAATTLADFGDPTTTESYRLCVYDEDAGVPQLVASSGIAAGGTCDGKLCWRASNTGFRYRDSSAAAEGVRQVVLKAGAAGRSKIQVRSQGQKLALPSLPFAQDAKATVQFKSSSGACWEADYGPQAQRNQPDQFKDRAD